MPYQPLMDGSPMTNTFEEHLFKARIVFGSSVVSSYSGKDVVLSRVTTGQYLVTLPKSYRRWTSFDCGWKRASGAPLQARVASYDLTAGTFTLETVNTSGTATDPTSGDELTFTIGVTENTLNDMFTTTV